jgi:hypothetical protein
VVGGIDTGALDTGNWPTAVKAPLGRAGTVPDGALLEAHRLADNVVAPFEADPAFSDAEMARAMPLRSAGALSWALPKPIPDGASDHNFVTGFSAERMSKTLRELTNVVLRFATPEDAAAAVAGLSAKSANVESKYKGPQPTHPIPIPRHPGTTAVTYTESLPVNGSLTNVFAYTPHGPYVLCQYADGTEGVDVFVNLVAATLDLQEPRIDQFIPTPAEQLPELPIDPSGLWARSLSEQTQPLSDDGVYDAHAILHFQRDAGRSKQRFDSAGLQYVSRSLDTVYQTADAAAGALLDQALTADAAAQGPAAGGVRGLTAGKCFKSMDAPTDIFNCVAQADKYVIEVTGDDPEVREKLAAQYLMLTAQ